MGIYSVDLIISVVSGAREGTLQNTYQYFSAENPRSLSYSAIVEKREGKARSHPLTHRDLNSKTYTLITTIDDVNIRITAKAMTSWNKVTDRRTHNRPHNHITGEMTTRRYSCVSS